ncbi:transaldolase family protein [Candidatus Lokiarchaeum ossiferum]|uniref:transaldolase family protein n=1 Tax=Candidatus Lokiarchaeum ossiferum TaxID=2951803 RepID=UPI00352BD7E6
MKYFLDSAKIDEIKYAYENWGIDGVTSNPKHIQNSGKPFFTVVKELAEFAKEVRVQQEDFSISVEINPHLEKAEEMIEEAQKIFNICPETFAIKIPCNEQGLIAAKKLTEAGVRVNVTLVFSASQALQVGRIGAAFCSPFIGWQESAGVDCEDFMERIVQMYNNFGIQTEIITAAVRNGKQISDAACLGADIVTAGFAVYQTSFEHPFTNKGLKIFQDSWDATEIGKFED